MLPWLIELWVCELEMFPNPKNATSTMAPILHSMRVLCTDCFTVITLLCQRSIDLLSVYKSSPAIENDMCHLPHSSVDLISQTRGLDVVCFVGRRGAVHFGQVAGPSLAPAVTATCTPVFPRIKRRPLEATPHGRREARCRAVGLTVVLEVRVAQKGPQKWTPKLGQCRK